MTFHDKMRAAQLFEPRRDLMPVRDFLCEHGAALASAANLLGGAPASGRVLLLIEALREARRLTRAHRRQLVALHELLTLRHAGDPERIETARFADIDPDAAEVEQICLLAEALETLLRMIAAPDAEEAPEEDARSYFAKVA